MLKVFEKLKYHFYYKSSGKRMISFYRKNGVKIGDRTIIFDPKDIQIDYTRPELIEIGEHVFLHKGTKIFTHDWASWCFLDRYNDFIPSHRKVVIGNNVWLGEDVKILGGASIGNDCIIGIGSIVTNDIPSGSLAIGAPARVVGSIDEFYYRRKKLYINEIVQYAIQIFNSGRTPQIKDFYDDYPIFVDGGNFQEYDYPYLRIFSPSQFEEWKKNHKKVFDNFDDFLNYISKVIESPRNNIID